MGGRLGGAPRPQLTRLALVAVAVLAAVPAAAHAAPGAPACVAWASPDGDDGDAGTQRHPFRTITHLAAKLHAGQTGCLAAGTTFHEHVAIARGGGLRAPIRIMTGGTPQALLAGRLVVKESAHDVVVALLTIQGDGSPGKAVVSIRGSRTTLVRDSVSGPGYLNASVACVRIDGAAAGVRLEHDTIHDCTRVTTRRVYSPGVVVAHARGAAIADSVLYHVSGDAIALAPEARGTVVTHDIIDGNTSGVLLGGSSSGNRIVRNIISFSGRSHVHSAGLHGGGNVVAGNCLWAAFGRSLAGGGYAAHGNLDASPRYVHRIYSYSVRPGACFAKRPRPWYLARTDLGMPWPRLARFTVRYTLRALPRKVEVVGLSLTALAPGASVEVRCARRCGAVERLRATSGGTASSAALRGTWLPRGAVITVRERRAGWIGAYARVLVTGLPHGVTIRHACLSPLDQQQAFSCGRFP